MDCALLILPASRRGDSGWIWHLVIEARDFNRLPWRHWASPSTTLDELRLINGCGYIDE